MSPCADLQGSPPSSIQAACGRTVTIKNTFLDDWDDEAYIEKRRASRRPFRTMPDLVGRGSPEPEAELSPAAAAAKSIQLQPLAPVAGAPGRRDAAPAAADDAFGDVLGWVPDDDDGPEGSTPPASSSSAAPATVRGANTGAAQGQHQATGSSKAAGPPSHPAEASARSGRRERNRAPSKLWCHLYLDEGTLAHDAFNLNKKIIGHGGNFTKDIFVDTGAKIRLRGRGSKHLENGREAPVPLMLAVTAELSERENFARAVEKAAAHLHSVERCYGKFCTNKNLPAPAGPFFWVGEFGVEARGCLIPILGEHLSAVPTARKSRRHTWAAPPAVS